MGKAIITRKGLSLPDLTSPAIASEILINKQTINQDGEIITGTKKDGIKGRGLLCGNFRYNTLSTGFTPTTVFYWFSGLDRMKHDVHFFMWYDSGKSTTNVFYTTDSIVTVDNLYDETGAGTRKCISGTLAFQEGYTYVNSSGVCLPIPDSTFHRTNVETNVNYNLGINYLICP